MPKRSKILISIGVILVIGSLVLLGVLWIMTDMAKDKAENIVSHINEVLPDRSVGARDNYSDMNMPVLEIADEDFVALVSVPKLDVVLPVGSTWDSDVIPSYPRRIGGTVYDGTLEIGVIDQRSQYDFFRRIEMGMEVVITDMTGAEFTYTVYRADRSDSSEESILRDDKTELVLTCRDTYLMECITVYCTTDK